MGKKSVSTDIFNLEGRSTRKKEKKDKKTEGLGAKRGDNKNTTGKEAKKKHRGKHRCSKKKRQTHPQLKHSNTFHSTHVPPSPNTAKSTPSPTPPSIAPRPRPPVPSLTSPPTPTDCTTIACWVGSAPITGDFARPNTLRQDSTRGVASHTRSSPLRSGTRLRGSAPTRVPPRDALFRSRCRRGGAEARACRCRRRRLL